MYRAREAASAVSREIRSPAATIRSRSATPSRSMASAWGLIPVSNVAFADATA